VADQTETTAADHPYFHPLPDLRAESLAAHLYLYWQQHEAMVAEWIEKMPLPWNGLEPDQQRSYRALAMAALEFLR